MARRKRNSSPLEDIFEVLLLLPWWVLLSSGIGLWVYLKGLPSPAGFVLEPSVMVWYLLQFLKWACFLAAFITGIQTLSRKALFASANDVEAIRAMSWRQFETLVGEAYRRQGYMVEETGGGGADGGIDLILRGKGQKILVQCKQWRSFKVGVKVVREMYGIMVAARADRVIVVTSGVYTQESCVFARGKPIELIDGRSLVQLIRTVKREAVAARNVASAQPAQPAPTKVLSVRVAASAAAAPTCPKCGVQMVMRTARKGPNAGNTFWGCPRFPSCRGILNM